VGDTAYLLRTLPAAPGVRVRPQPLASTPLLEPLTDPMVEQRAELVTVRYAVALFEPGALLAPGSAAPIAEAFRQSLGVLSTSVAWLVYLVTFLAPWLLVGLVALGGSAWALARRRVRSRPSASGDRPQPGEPPLQTWVEAGELRAAAASVTERLRSGLARLEPGAGAGLPTDALLAVLRLRRPSWPLSEIEELLHALERARFAPAVPDDVLILKGQVADLLERLAQPEPARRTGSFEVAPEQGS
jgi:hypothetical protein